MRYAEKNSRICNRKMNSKKAVNIDSLFYFTIKKEIKI